MRSAPIATVDLVADITCPWCTLARQRLDAALVVLAEEGLPLDWAWRPFLLHPDAPPGGFDQAAHLVRRFGSAAASDRYHDGVAEAGRAVGFTFRYERIAVMPNTLDAHRVLLFAARSGHQAGFADRLARAFFTEGLDIGQGEVLVGLAAGIGLDDAACRTMLAGDDYREAVIASDRMAKRYGIRHVPAFCLHGRILDVPAPDELADVLRGAYRALAGLKR